MGACCSSDAMSAAGEDVKPDMEGFFYDSSDSDTSATAVGDDEAKHDDDDGGDGNGDDMPAISLEPGILQEADANHDGIVTREELDQWAQSQERHLNKWMGDHSQHFKQQLKTLISVNKQLCRDLASVVIEQQQQQQEPAPNPNPNVICVSGTFSFDDDDDDAGLKSFVKEQMRNAHVNTWYLPDWAEEQMLLNSVKLTMGFIRHQQQQQHSSGEAQEEAAAEESN